jgi:hypothetical protein
MTRHMGIAEIKQLIDDGKIEYVKIGAPDIESVVGKFKHRRRRLPTGIVGATWN